MLFNLFYRLVLFCYHTIIRSAAYWKPKAQAWVSGRRNWLQQLTAWRTTHPTAKVFWIHCASLGEFEQGRPILEAWRSQHPDWKIALSFYSPSGYELRKNYPQADYIAYLPADSPMNAKNWIATLRPDLAIFVKYEFWYYHLTALQKAQVPTYLIAASFRPKQPFFRWYGKQFRQLLAGFTHIFVQNTADKDLLATIDIQKVTVAGDPRLDRTLQIAAEAAPIPEIADFKGDAHLFIAGSSWPVGEDLLLANPQLWTNKWKLLLVPHDISEKHMLQICSKLTLPYLRYSQLSDDSDLDNARVLIIDAIGLLASAYAYGELAYIGGGFGSGLHNTLEPTAHGLPVFFGPKYHKFPEAVHFATQGGGFVVERPTDFETQFKELSTNKTTYQEAVNHLQAYFRQARGASMRIISKLS